MNKTALTITIALTAFLLIIVAAVFFGVKTTQPATAAVQPTAEITDVPASTQAIDEQVQRAIQERDAAYQDLINQANARLDALQKENQVLQAQLSSVQNPLPQDSTPTSISPETAAQVAANWVGDSQIFSVESVTIRNAPVYKVTFSSGVIVYVSPDGQVVGSQMPLMNVSNTNNVQRRGGGGGESEGHEGGDD